jgi:DNA polymerase III sliding clamp (beta) subunit (PCNA family)
MKHTDVLKLIGKLTKKHHIQIMENIAVKDNVIQANDLETAIFYKNPDGKIEDGIYSGLHYRKGHVVPTADSLDDYPIITQEIETDMGTITGCNRLKHCNDIVPTESKFSFTGAIIEQTEDDNFCFVATDGHRLIAYGDHSSKMKLQFIVNKITAECLYLDDEWQLSKSEHFLIFRGPTITVYQRHVDQKFPNWRMVVPNIQVDKSYQIIGDESLIDCISFFFSECKKSEGKTRHNGVSIGVKDGCIDLKREVISKNILYHCQGPKTDAEKINVAVNAEFIKDINSIPGQKTVLYKDENSSVVTMIEGDGVVIVMPLLQ